MKQRSLLLTTIASLHIVTPSVMADLPELKEKPHLGYFVVLEDRETRFGITSEGLGHVFPLDKKGQVLRVTNPIKVDFRMVEILPTGRITRKNLVKDSLSTTQDAAVNPDKPVTFSGKFAGDAGFDTTVTPIRGGFTISGKLTEKGTSTNQAQFGVDLKFDPYRNLDLSTEKLREKFEELSKRDELEVVGVKGEKKKFDIDEEAHLAGMFPDGVSQVTIESVRYEGLDVELVASEGSRLMFARRDAAPVYESLKLVWVMKEGADPAKEKLTFTMK